MPTQSNRDILIHLAKQDEKVVAIEKDILETRATVKSIDEKQDTQFRWFAGIGVTAIFQFIGWIVLVAVSLLHKP